MDYRGEFANVFDKWNLEILARVTSPNFSINFFGFGNETKNVDNLLGMDYNRVRVETLKFTPSLVWRGDLGAKFKVGISYENIEVEETNDRFINTFYLGNGQESNSSFFGVDMEYTYENADSVAFPTMGMATVIQMGYKRNLENSQYFSYITPSLSFNYKLVPKGNLVIATKAKAHFNLGDGYKFYHGATIGASDGLRGFRNQRFTGKTSFYQNTDIRLNFKKMKTGLLPLSLGVYGGFDYGRVWMPGMNSNQWHTSYGGGFFLNTANIVSLKIAYFRSVEDSLFSFGLGFGF